MMPRTIDPERVYEQAVALKAPRRAQALMVCAQCRERHGGMCVADLTADSACCPLIEVHGIVAEPVTEEEESSEQQQ